MREGVKKEICGCACCSPEFGTIFNGNRKVSELSAMNPSEISVNRDQPPWMGVLDRRSFIKGSLVAAGTTVLLHGPTGYTQTNEEITTVFTGGTVLTVDSKFSQAEAIAIRGNKILAVGTDTQVRAAAGENAKIIDLEGKTVLPGFIDPHTHVVAGSVVDSVMEYVGMARFGTVDEVLKHLDQLVKGKAPGEWIVVRNFDPAVQVGPDALTFKELDAVSTQHPIFVFNASGHLAYANSKAFEVAGIPADVENPPGAEFVRDEDGKLTGIMKNNVALLQVLGKYPALTEVDPIESLIGLLGK